jgi:hypothetical protein
MQWQELRDGVWTIPATAASVQDALGGNANSDIMADIAGRESRSATAVVLFRQCVQGELSLVRVGLGPSAMAALFIDRLFRNNSGSLAMFVAIASSSVSDFTAGRCRATAGW